jgi:hypothetical protein
VPVSQSAGDREPGCAVCRRVRRAESEFLSLFISETHAHPGMLSKLCEARGLCPAHARAFLSFVPNTRIPTFVYSHVIAATALYLRENADSRELCPGCVTVERAQESSLRQVRESGGTVCLEHTDVRASPTEIESLLLVEDRDAGLRARIRDHLPREHPTSANSTLDVLVESLVVSCPLCHAAGVAEQALLAAAAEGHAPDDCCGGHLRDLAGIDADAARRIEVVVTRNRLSEAGTRGCALCRALAVVDERQTQLLLVGLNDARVRRSYEAGPGLCHQHVLNLGNRAPPVVAAVLSSRVDVLHWELDEAVRKISWSDRYETPGAESDAWLRAPLQLNGHVALGGSSATLTPILRLMQSSLRT